MKFKEAVNKVIDEYEPCLRMLGGNMNKEQQEHCDKNRGDFNKKYLRKYRAGQKEHGGNMWTMGAYQALEQMEAEVLDQWSYARQIRKVLDEIREIVEKDFQTDPTTARLYLGTDKVIAIKEILNRVKDDGKEES